MVNFTTFVKSKRKRKKDITFQDIQENFDLPIKEAADALQISLTQLKRICRENDIPRWPYRKLQALQNKLEDLQDGLAQADELTRQRTQSKIDNIHEEIKFIRAYPKTIIESGGGGKRNSITKSKRWSLPSMMSAGDSMSSCGSGISTINVLDQTFGGANSAANRRSQNEEEFFKDLQQRLSKQYGGMPSGLLGHEDEEDMVDEDEIIGDADEDEDQAENNKKQQSANNNTSGSRNKRFSMPSLSHNTNTNKNSSSNSNSSSSILNSLTPKSNNNHSTSAFTVVNSLHSSNHHWNSSPSTNHQYPTTSGNSLGGGGGVVSNTIIHHHQHSIANQSPYHHSGYQQQHPTQVVSSPPSSTHNYQHVPHHHQSNQQQQHHHTQHHNNTHHHLYGHHGTTTQQQLHPQQSYHNTTFVPTMGSGAGAGAGSSQYSHTNAMPLPQTVSSPTTHQQHHTNYYQNNQQQPTPPQYGVGHLLPNSSYHQQQQAITPQGATIPTHQVINPQPTNAIVGNPQPTSTIAGNPQVSPRNPQHVTTSSAPPQNDPNNQAAIHSLHHQPLNSPNSSSERTKELTAAGLPPRRNDFFSSAFSHQPFSQTNRPRSLNISTPSSDSYGFTKYLHQNGNYLPSLAQVLKENESDRMQDSPLTLNEPSPFSSRPTLPPVNRSFDQQDIANDYQRSDASKISQALSILKKKNTNSSSTSVLPQSSSTGNLEQTPSNSFDNFQYSGYGGNNTHRENLHYLRKGVHSTEFEYPPLHQYYQQYPDQFMGSQPLTSTTHFTQQQMDSNSSSPKNVADDKNSKQNSASKESGSSKLSFLENLFRKKIPFIRKRK